MSNMKQVGPLWWGSASPENAIMGSISMPLPWQLLHTG
jgi:hypothetical protein